MKAVALVSGGLDSYIAAKAMQEQGIELVLLNFQTPMRQGAADESRSADVEAISSVLGAVPEVEFLGEDFLEAVRRPKFGRGKNLNPCIDCRVLMLRRAGERMREEGARFVVTGEVLGQRPLSQHLKALKLIDRESGLERLVLRPLSAGLLEPTIPEIEGWVDRSRLLAISGRGRREQLRLARQYGIDKPPTPAGGCLLTDPVFSKRLRDLMESRGKIDPREAELLKHGRYLRFAGKGGKEEAQPPILIVGRNRTDNASLESLAGRGDWLLKAFNCPGPTAIGIGKWDRGLAALAASIVARYSDTPKDGLVEVEIREGGTGSIERVAVKGMEPEEAGAVRI